MCGIVGLIRPIGVKNFIVTAAGQQLDDAIAAMTRAVHHRGPDGAGAWSTTSGAFNLALGHTRLSILDLSLRANQPMVDPASGCVLVYNGEIYNYLELRGELLRADERPFNSTGDTEVLLRAYVQWGAAFVQKLRGMFAFAIFDPRHSRLLLGRDQLGIKPLYLTETFDGHFAFASEVRALLALPWVQRVLDPLGLMSYLAYGSAQDPYTLVRGIRAAPAGHIVEVDLSLPRLQVGEPQRYWSLPAVQPKLARLPHGEVVRQVRAALEESVRLHLASDVPLGVFLSGGIDSSSLLALMAEVAGTQVNSLNVSFDVAAYDESAIARQVAEHYGARHTSIRLTATGFLDDFSGWLAAQDQPSADGANTWVVSRACRQAGLTVALSGLGGDELFAGYHTFHTTARGVRLFKTIQWLPRPARERLRQTMLRAGGDAIAVRKLADWVVGDGSTLSTYLTVRRMFTSVTLEDLLDPFVVSLAQDYDLSPSVVRHLEQLTNSIDPVAATSFMELSTYLTNTLLRDSDQMGMAHSVEIRVPFVDRAVVELVAGLPGSIRTTGKGAKPLLTAAMGDRLDQAWAARPKWTFSFPFDQWLRGPLRQSVDRLLREMDSFPFRANFVQDLWQSFLDGQRGVNSGRILTLFSLATWLSRHGIVSEL
jgi:asparagine synthase (glutamine-hydrolysing)